MSPLYNTFLQHFTRLLKHIYTFYNSLQQQNFTTFYKTLQDFTQFYKTFTIVYTTLQHFIYIYIYLNTLQYFTNLWTYFTKLYKLHKNYKHFPNIHTTIHKSKHNKLSKVYKTFRNCTKLYEPIQKLDNTFCLHNFKQTYLQNFNILHNTTNKKLLQQFTKKNSTKLNRTLQNSTQTFTKLFTRHINCTTLWNTTLNKTIHNSTKLYNTLQSLENTKLFQNKNTQLVLQQNLQSFPTLYNILQYYTKLCDTFTQLYTNKT